MMESKKWKGEKKAKFCYLRVLLFCDCLKYSAWDSHALHLKVTRHEGWRALRQCTKTRKWTAKKLRLIRKPARETSCQPPPTMANSRFWTLESHPGNLTVTWVNTAHEGISDTLRQIWLSLSQRMTGKQQAVGLAPLNRLPLNGVTCPSHILLCQLFPKGQKTYDGASRWFRYQWHWCFPSSVCRTRVSHQSHFLFRFTSKWEGWFYLYNSA